MEPGFPIVLSAENSGVDIFFTSYIGHFSTIPLYALPEL
jgi:hypothetical protein